jgi:ABC-type sugar transport system ATPase subunit
MNLPTTIVIETSALSKTYKKFQALWSLDLKVRQNLIYSLPGSKEAGKQPPSSSYPSPDRQISAGLSK